MEKSSTLYVGLDVHKESDRHRHRRPGRDGEVRHVCSTGGDLVALDKALRKLTSKGHPLHVVYEAGPCGFVIWRHLIVLGIPCEVVAPSSILKRSADRVKTDRRDAMMLARLSRPCDLTAVRVPVPATKPCAILCVPARTPCANAAVRANGGGREKRATKPVACAVNRTAQATPT